jgi:crotonobetainyl-CoA:carnitine CoA-transferase CaiB-like acyl-CoA transferase
LDDPRFTTLAKRVANIDQTYQETAKTMLTRTTKEWLDIFGSTSVPTIVVNTLDELVTDEHLVATGFWKQINHPTEGKLRTPAFPVNYSATPADETRLHQPHLGEHSVAILKDAGLDQAAIDTMLASKATVQAAR